MLLHDTLVGRRIRLDAMPEDPDPVPPGTEGTVQMVTKLDGWTQVLVDWDNGSKLALSIPPDRFTVLP
jgi:hypothetical protein